MLSDPEPKVRACSARVLADAEPYRGVGSPSGLLDDPVAEVRAEAMRALGLIRDDSAIERLRSPASDPRQPPEVSARALIALQRPGLAGLGWDVRCPCNRPWRRWNSSKPIRSR
jgi:HEAT repeat protein